MMNNAQVQDLRKMTAEVGYVPPVPKTIEETQLSADCISELLLKHFYKYGRQNILELSSKIKLPHYLLEPLLDDLIHKKLIEKSIGKATGELYNQYALLHAGYGYVKNILSRDSYIGPAPVSLEQYCRVLERNHQDYAEVDADTLKEAWYDLVLDERYFNQIGPAIYSGRSCYIYGPAGSGKTYLAKKVAAFIAEYFGPIAIPYSISVGGYTIQTFDPLYHTVEDETRAGLIQNNHPDRRWVKSKRPVILCGGELTLHMLDLQYKENVSYYEAPIQVKANGGVLIIDDFGRQNVNPKRLLNRWIYPLEERMDYLTLHTGYKFPVPFDLFVIFATNLQLEDLQDEAFMRRIPYKIFLSSISEDSFRKIFHNECRLRHLSLDVDAYHAVVERFYTSTQKPMLAYQPREITEKVCNYCKFHKITPNLTPAVLEDVF